MAQTAILHDAAIWEDETLITRLGDRRLVALRVTTSVDEHDLALIVAIPENAKPWVAKLIGLVVDMAADKGYRLAREHETKGRADGDGQHSGDEPDGRSSHGQREDRAS